MSIFIHLILIWRIILLLILIIIEIFKEIILIGKLLIETLNFICPGTVNIHIRSATALTQYLLFTFSYPVLNRLINMKPVLIICFITVLKCSWLLCWLVLSLYANLLLIIILGYLLGQSRHIMLLTLTLIIIHIGLHHHLTLFLFITILISIVLKLICLIYLLLLIVFHLLLVSLKTNLTVRYFMLKFIRKLLIGQYSKAIFNFVDENINIF